jgi:hypothetical protein
MVCVVAVALAAWGFRTRAEGAEGASQISEAQALDQSAFDWQLFAQSIAILVLVMAGCSLVLARGFFELVEISRGLLDSNPHWRRIEIPPWEFRSRRQTQLDYEISHATELTAELEEMKQKPLLLEPGLTSVQSEIEAARVHLATSKEAHRNTAHKLAEMQRKIFESQRPESDLSDTPR